MSANNVFKSCSINGMTMKILRMSSGNVPLRVSIRPLLNVLIKRVTNDNLPYPNDVLMPARHHQRHDFSQTCYWESLFLFLQLELFERVYPSGVITSRPEYDAVCPFFNMVQPGILIY